MRLISTIIFCAVIATICAGPEPKKYKTDVKEKDKKSNTTLTEEERKFLREVEAKFGIKADADNKESEQENKTVTNVTTPFPAIIAIEIVNDTDSKSKGKRTIDANLGYGYKTNNGYSYSYFGKGAQEKGKFMIYPYSQQDIPPVSHPGENYDHAAGRHPTVSTKVEIQPSRAFELVPVKDEKNSYPYKSQLNGHRTNYNNIKGLVSPPPQHSQVDYSQHQAPASHPSTLYTTYNGKGFSGLSGQFPTVMPNYFVDPTQLLKYPEYKSAGLTPDHLNNLQDTKPDHRVVPVLVLRIPSSSLKNPTAELFANLPENYPLSRYLNNVNLQELVNQYFKKMGYSHGPPVMAYQESLTLKPSDATVAAPATNYEPQQYAHPYVQPSYTHADFSGVQYSAVKPVMARYPSSYTRQQYYLPPGHSLYHQPMHQQKYEYRYQYVPQSVVPTQAHYVEPQYQQQTHQADQATSQESGYQDATLNHQTHVQDTSAEVEYSVPAQAADHGSSVTTTFEYVNPQAQVQTNYEARTPSPEYGVVPQKSEVDSAEYDTNKVTRVPVYGPPKEESGAQQQYFTVEQPIHSDAAAVYQAQVQQNAQKYYSEADSGENQGYVYQQPASEDSAHNLVLTENYPSKDHTIATVLPLSYKTRQPTSGPVQTVTYVTPMPYSYKYQSPYKVMIPQTYLKHPDSEKVAYVNSHSFSTSHTQTGLHYEQNPEAEYTLPSQYIPPVGKQKPPAYPRNYHSHPKRMARPENKSENATHAKKQNGGSDKRKSS
ncbi:uncharacterized protein LOC115442846 [Manduca sexta]|uniref:Uncharacterized protein n=1 Tax=Manduca sexta TaxID=7130 RepID=A0A922CCP2_MANSE|nr:uncharacterized protein LOC115442846 [Manduca sexta]KAG6440944.1 hypothetical protein O3G_MSEX001640 [Manduca sexta]KAG6440945.1 hypothetical protein O3G_MSEX001640 [Manduca sexta]